MKKYTLFMDNSFISGNYNELIKLFNTIGDAFKHCYILEYSENETPKTIILK